MTARLRTLLGGSVIGPLALTVLVLGCVFVAIAGPRYSLDSRTRALREDIASLPPNQTAVQVSADWNTFTTQVSATSGFSGPAVLSDAQLTEAARQLSHALAAIPLPVTAGGWDGVTTNYLWDYAGITRSYTREYPVKLELSYRPQLPAYASVTAGSLTRSKAGNGFLPVAASTATAARFGLHVGSELTLLASTPVRLLVTAIVRPAQTGSAFWLSAPELGQPTLTNPFAAPLQWTPQSLPYYKGSYWVGGFFADPGAFAAMQSAYAPGGMTLSWEIPLNLGHETADQVAALSGEFARATANSVTLTGSLRNVSAFMTVNSSMAGALSAYTATEDSVQQVLSLAAVSLTLTGLALLMLTARLVASRRSAEFTMLRSRGGSLWQVTLLALRAGALTCLPGVVLGVVAGVLATRGESPPLAWWLGGVTAVTAVLSLPVTVAWQYRRPGGAAASAALRSPSAPRRLIAELTACAAAAGALFVLHAQGTPPGSVNFYVAATPALVAVPAVIVAARLYPLVIRAVLPLQARGGGATGFLAMAQAARTSLVGVAPAFALVLALTLAAFAGMVQRAIGAGEISASWQTTGADVLVIATPVSPITAADEQAIAALPGVRHATAVWQIVSVPITGQSIITAIVDPASYAAYSATTPFPVAPAGQLGQSATVLSAVASPQVAAALGNGVIPLASTIGSFQVRITGTVAGTPAIPAGDPGSGAFLIIPDDAAILHPGYPPLDNQLLITGSGINRDELSKLVPPGATIAYRSDILASLTGAPLQSGAYLLLRLSLVVAAGFGLIIVMLGLALGSADRDLTLARLSTMGLNGSRLGRLVLYETLPAIAAAVVAAAACALVLPLLIAPGLDLGSFTGPHATVTLAPDFGDIVLPALALVLLTAIAVAAELRHLRHRGIAPLLRF